MDAAFRAELVRLLPRLRRFALGLAGTQDEADDLVQEACSRAIERARQWQKGSRLDSWMYRIIQTLRIDRLRAQNRQAVPDPDALEAMPGGDAEPEMESRLTLAAVRRIVERLPEEQRAVLLLVCAEGLTYRETAETLKIPLGTVMSRLSRARQALDAALDRPATSSRTNSDVITPFVRWQKP